ncbi:MAG: hypothetical protein M0R51_12440 [Clostridia bacterium]|jgi:hypothetical protein|nr:hypothetical protein [Clostridia bacterium]
MSKELEALLHEVMFDDKEYTPDEYWKIYTKISEALTPSIEQEEALKILDWLTVGHPTPQTYIETLRIGGYDTLADDYLEDDKKCDKLRRYILQPRKALTTDRTLEIVKELKDVVYCLEYLTKRWTGNSFNKSYRLSLDFSVVFDRIDFDKLNKIISESEGTK